MLATKAVTDAPASTGVQIDKDSRAYRLFLASIKSPSTRKTYDMVLPIFLNFAGYQRLEEMLESEPKAIENKLIDFVIEKRKVSSYSTVTVHLAAIRKLCLMNDITSINWEKIYTFLGEHTTTIKDRIYTHAEIQKIMERASFRTKVVILILLSTGVRIGALPGLKIKHLLRIESENLYQFTIYENSKEEYITFCSPECAKTIDAYLEYRKRAGEDIRPDSPLLREEFDPNDIKAVENPRAPALITLRASIRSLLIKTGIREKTSGRERKELMICHALRKYYNTQLVKAGAKPVIKEILLGHSVNLDDSYYRPTTTELLNEYLKATPLLTVSNEKQLQHEVERLRAEVSDIDTMKKGYLEMKIKYEARIERLEKIILGLKDHIDEDLEPMAASIVEDSVPV